MSVLPRRAAEHPGGRSDPVARIDRVSKIYGLATVLDEVSFEVGRGEVHALVGENGAGKSTLAKILAGFVAPNAGHILIEGKTVEQFSVQHAESAGVTLIHQELALAEHLSVVENIFLGHELRHGPFLAVKEMSRRAGEMLRQLGCSVSLKQAISSLPVSDMQMVEVAKALLRDARLIIMDEPTAVLTPRESENLFAQIDGLRANGVSIIFVSHKLDEVKKIADRVTVLRDGKFQGTWPADQLSVHEIANLMVGREISQIYPPKSKREATEVALSVRNYRGDASSDAASFEIRFGEVLGVAGLVGSGRTELFEALVGLRSSRAGEVLLRGQPFRPADYNTSIAAGLVYITEDRKGRGLLLQDNIAHNVSMLDQIVSGSLLVDAAKLRKSSKWAVREFNIDAPYPGIRVGRLSGGNQQKVLLAKSLLTKPTIIIVDEPTRGIDVGTRSQIYTFLRRLADEGNAIVAISSDMQEIIGLSDRVMVMRDHSVAGFVDGESVSEERIVQLATGVAKDFDGEI